MMQMMAVEDSKGEMWMEPFFAPNVAIAVRNFSEVCRRADHPFHLFPEDFSLYLLAEWDPVTGRLAPLEEYVEICSALDVVGPREED